MGIFLQLETQEHLESFAKDPHHLRLAKVTTDMQDEYLRIEDSMTCANKYARTALHSTWLSKYVLLTWDPRRSTSASKTCLSNWGAA